MDNIGGRPLVNVMINGKGPYPFILDTGASITAVDPDLIKELALPPRMGDCLQCFHEQKNCASATLCFAE